MPELNTETKSGTKSDKLMSEALKAMDPEVFGWIVKETDRQKNGLEMIASENYTSRAVMEAQGSVSYQ